MEYPIVEAFKIFSTLVLPSVFVFLLILVGLLLILVARKPRLGKGMMIIGVLLYYLLSLNPVADLILYPLEGSYHVINQDEYPQVHTAVVLLGGQEGDILRGSTVVQIYYHWVQRHEMEKRVIVSGVDPLNLAGHETEDLRDYLAERGVSSKDIELDKKSRNTYESAVNVKALVGQEPFFLVTSGYHMKRSILAFIKSGTHPIPAAADLELAPRYHLMDFIPNSNSLRKSDLAFHEYAGLVFYRLFH